MSESLNYEAAILCASRSSMTRAFVGYLDRRCGITPGSRVVVAVSGGPDSVALAVLSAAVSLRRTPAVIRPIIAHVDHGLRDESGEEARMVAELAAGLGVPSRSCAVDVVRDGKGLSAAARDARYTALANIAHETGATAVLTGHHADDQSETMLLAMARGSGLAGIQGMPYVRPLDGDVRLCRPVLSFRRSSLHTLVEDCGLPYCIDPGNTSTESPRSVVRNEVIPLLERIYPGASERISELANDIRHECSGGAYNATVSWKRAALKTISHSECAATIRNASLGLDSTAASCSRSHWQSVVDMIQGDRNDPRVIEITKNLTIVVDSKEVRFAEAASND